MESAKQHDQRMAWWREARFGMFIHWGLYSVPAGRWQGKDVPGIGEWLMNTARVPVADYAKLSAQFDPTKFDADAWVRLAKQAGMKYIVITSKHHDGFAMYHSSASPFNIYDATPFKRDPLKELAAACRKHGIRFGLYYSQAQDWHHPGGAAAGGRWDPAQDGSMDDYVRNIAVRQVREILSNYGPISVLWWDTPVDMDQKRIDMILPLLKLQPNIITNDRLGSSGDFSTPEQFIPTSAPKGDWETCMTINDTWGFKSEDHNWKPTAVLVRNLIDIASKGGNYLLNVGPTAEGEIPAPSIERLHEIGQWIKINGEAIYGSQRSPFRRLSPNVRCTVKGKKLYFFVFDWPANGVEIPGIETPFDSIRMLGSRAKVKYSAQCERDRGCTLTIQPPAKPDPIATVIELTFSEPLKIVSNLPVAVPDSSGALTLRAPDADIHGSAARCEGTGGNTNIGYWTDQNDYISWDLAPKTSGDYDVAITYACQDDTPGAAFTIQVNDAARVSGAVKPTGGWQNYITDTIGRIHLATGKRTLTLKPASKPGFAVMNLREVRLTPVR